MMKSHRDIEVRYSDTDQMGVVYHANYLTYFELGRMSLFKEVGYTYADLEVRGYIYPVREVKCKYISAIHYGESIYVETSVKKVSKILVVYLHEIFNEKKELKAVGESTVVCVSKNDFKIARMDKCLPNIYDIYKNLTMNE